jgi:hypothetical protein
MKPPIPLRTAPALLVLLLAACGTSGARRGDAARPKCDANGAPNSELAFGRSCRLFVRTEKRCVYDAEGRLKDIAAKTVGACL